MEYPKRETLEAELYEDLKGKMREYHEGVLDVEKEKEGEALVEKMYLSAQEGCVPDEFLGEELLYSVKSKFYGFFSVICDKVKADYLEKKNINYPVISISIDPSYEDTTYVVVTFQNAVLCEFSAKAWNFVWPTLPALKKEMADHFYQIRDQLNQYFVEGLRYRKN